MVQSCVSPLAFNHADTLCSPLCLPSSSYLMDGAESSSESEMEVDDQSEEEINITVYLSFLSESI